MLKTLKKEWHHFASLPAGERFITQYREHQARRKSAWAKGVSLGAGLVLTAVGLVALPAPGPGLLIVAFGAALVARESKVVATALDQVELFLRRVVAWLRRQWRAAATWQRIVLAVVAVAIALAALWLVLRFMGWLP